MELPDHLLAKPEPQVAPCESEREIEIAIFILLLEDGNATFC